MLDAPPLPLLDLPEPSLLRLVSSEGQTAVSFGDKVLFCLACDDVGMRNMAVVALTDAGVQGKQVAAAFGLSAEYVSILRGRARTDGSETPVPRTPPRTPGALALTHDLDQAKGALHRADQRRPAALHRHRSLPRVPVQGGRASPVRRGQHVYHGATVLVARHVTARSAFTPG